MMDRETVQRLYDLAPMNSPDLHDQIFKEILEPGERFTKESADEYKAGMELLGKLFMIHRDYNERHPFGDMFSEYLEEYGKLNFHAGQFFTPYNVAGMMGGMLLSLEEMKGDPLTMLDPAAGTGRFMLKTAEHYAKEVGMFNFIFTNIDIDRRVFIYCVMNAILYRIPSINIHGNTISNEFWDCFATIPTLTKAGVICEWRRIDAKIMEKRFEKMFEASRPAKGMEQFVGKVAKKDRPVVIRRYKPEPEQRTLFEG